MKITKYLHSCLVFEQDGYKLLFDPGKFSFAEGRVTPQMFADVDGIIITHIHPDHLDTENLKKIVELSKATIYTNTQVGEAIAKEGLAYSLMEQGTFNIGPFKLDAFPVQHEPLLDNPIPQMTGFLINDKILHPVDSMETRLTEYPDIELLILVTMAPFAMNCALPVLPIRLGQNRYYLCMTATQGTFLLNSAIKIIPFTLIKQV